MLRYKTTIKLLLPLIIGIVIGNFLELERAIPFTIWCTLFITLLILHYSGRKIYAYRTLIGFNIVLLFIVTGITNYSFHSPKLNPKNIANIYLPNDQIKVTIEELNYGKGDFYKSISRVESVIRGKDTVYVEGKILHFIHKDFGFLETGNQLIIQSDLQLISNKGNPGEFNQEAFWFNHFITLQSFSHPHEVKRLGKVHSFQTFWESIRNYLIHELEKNVAPDVVGLVTALSLGDKSLLSKEVSENFANAGAMHVLAVSGLHVGILLGIVQFLCKFFRFLQKNYRYLYVSLVIIWIYAMLTGMSPSVSRAALMFSILAIGRANGNSFFNLNSLLVSAFLLLLINPLLIYHIGFQLSYFAMFGISYFYTNISQLFSIQNKVIKKVWDGTALGIAAQIGTAPLSLYYFHQFPNFFMLTNVLFIFLAGIALGIVLLYFLVHFIPLISDLVVEGINFLYAFILDFVELINRLPFHVAKGFSLSIFSLLLFYASLSLLVHFRERKKTKPFLISLSILFLVTSGFVYNRFNNLNAQELIVFNHKYPVILVKYPGGTFCFYDQKAQNNEESVAFDVDLFHKLYGGKIYYQMLPNTTNAYQEIHLNNSIITIKNQASHIALSVGKETVVLPKKNKLADEETKHAKVVVGYFSKYYKGKTNHNLMKKGAFRMKVASRQTR